MRHELILPWIGGNVGVPAPVVTRKEMTPNRPSIPSGVEPSPPRQHESPDYSLP